jgi:hypothetical protein
MHACEGLIERKYVPQSRLQTVKKHQERVHVSMCKIRISSQNWVDRRTFCPETSNCTNWQHCSYCLVQNYSTTAHNRHRDSLITVVIDLGGGMRGGGECLDNPASLVVWIWLGSGTLSGSTYFLLGIWNNRFDVRQNTVLTTYCRYWARFYLENDPTAEESKP